MYNDVFDKELIDYLKIFFQLYGIQISEQTSFAVGENVYQIRFESEDFVLQFFYEKESAECEAQIRITNILIKGTLNRKGLSKKLINHLWDYCYHHDTMSLWIYDLINQSWKDYLVQKGSVIAREETRYEGAILYIKEKIE